MSHPIDHDAVTRLGGRPDAHALVPSPTRAARPTPHLADRLPASVRRAGHRALESVATRVSAHTDSTVRADVAALRADVAAVRAELVATRAHLEAELAVAHAELAALQAAPPATG
ncbi:MAG: hypothetical protein JWM05_2095 [Acidimicrobiales bacterium]|nr:hypothetical protein [Acidimicrobiales bacterium]